MFEMSQETAAEYGQKYRDLVTPRLNGEEVIAAAAFRRGGASASYVASKAQLGAIVYAAIRLFNKKRAGSLPERVMLALTPERLYAFNLAFRGRDVKLKEEVAVWERAGLRHSTDRRSGMTALTIESPGGGETVTLVGVGVRDDPISQELIAALEGTAADPG